VAVKALAPVSAAAMVALHFSVTEGWGLSIMESSASGTPTVAFRVPGVVDTINNNYNGFLVNRIDEFTDKILDIIKNENKFTINSRKFAERFTWEQTTDLWYKLVSDK
jgi:glycosyltransferase involved in cell wall biosynthesis